MDRDNRETERENRHSARKESRPSLNSEEGKVRMSDAVLIALVLVAALVSFTGITFSIQSIRNFTALSAVIYVITTMTYRNRYNHGKLRGRDAKEYKEAVQEYREALQKIPGEMTDEEIAEYCENYKKRELKNYRKDLLMGFHIEYDVYVTEYLGLTLWQVLRLKKPWKFRMIILKCNKAKPVKLSPAMIMNESGNPRRGRAIGISGEQRERRDKTWNALSKALLSIGGGAIVVSLVLDFSLQNLTQWAIRILPIIVAIFTGDSDGYDDIAVTESNHKREQTEIINRMVDEYCSRGKLKKQEKANACESIVTNQ